MILWLKKEFRILKDIFLEKSFSSEGSLYITPYIFLSINLKRLFESLFICYIGAPAQSLLFTFIIVIIIIYEVLHLVQVFLILTRAMFSPTCYWVVDISYIK